MLNGDGFQLNLFQVGTRANNGRSWKGAAFE